MFEFFLFCCFRERNLRRARNYALRLLESLDDKTFKKMFRVDRATFEDILDQVAPHIKVPNEVKACNSSGGSISLKTKLAVSLRWLAGGSYLDLCFAWGIALSMFYHPNGVLWPTLEAIDKAYPMGLPIGDSSKLEELSKGFFEHSGGILDGCVMAVDGLGVLTRQPFKSEVKKPKDYRFRKGGFAVIVLAGCDVNARFVSASCTHSGSTNDIIAWQESKLFQAIEVNKELPEKYFLIGDEAFTCSDQMLSPWPGKSFELRVVIYLFIRYSPTTFYRPRY